MSFERRPGAGAYHLNRRAFAGLGAGAVLSGCAGLRGGDDDVVRAGFAHPPPLAPLNVSIGRLTRITVCIRPFRPAGPRLEAEMVGGKRVVHNYGHGGAGWSLSWGCAQDAAALALQGGVRPVAVIGAGVMGLTTALRLAEAGAAVTIYAKDFPMETRSARATGVWSPSSRIVLTGDAPPDFADRWEGWARASYSAHQRYVGAAAEPVEYVRQYYLSDGQSPGVPASRDFLHPDRRLSGLAPRWSDVPDTENPFPVARARAGLIMTFNVASYAERLTRDFLLRGGRMVRRSFPERAEILQLSEPVIVNCTGYGAKALWEDRTLAPVRGQINWLAPQPEARYGVNYRGVFVISRRDGVVVQKTGPNDDFGFGDESETPDRMEMQDALATIAPLFADR
ncbi:FAD-dependent oxidoreductase [Hyphococcus sp.]|uniref:FAD-dependent oxidoreductase n=1 Tax=Hyphococcus sp. TaxID=2038636 RepID=UPI003CCC2D49